MPPSPLAGGQTIFFYTLEGVCGVGLELCSQTAPRRDVVTTRLLGVDKLVAFNTNKCWITCFQSPVDSVGKNPNCSGRFPTESRSRVHNKHRASTTSPHRGGRMHVHGLWIDHKILWVRHPFLWASPRRVSLCHQKKSRACPNCVQLALSTEPTRRVRRARRAAPRAHQKKNRFNRQS